MVALPHTFEPARHPVPPFTHNGDLWNLPEALASLVAQRRWLVWRWTYDPERQKWTKVPYQSARPHLKASTSKPATWGAHDAACQAVESGLADGIGYALTDGEIAAQDLDNCRDPATGWIDPQALARVEAAGSYAEVTPSGTGLRIIGYGQGEPVHRKQKLSGSAVSVESYRRATRYITITGLELEPRRSLAVIDAAIDATVAELDKKPVEEPPAVAARVERPAYRNGFNGLPYELEALIRDGALIGSRSEQFHHVVGWLKDLEKSPDEIEALLSAHPDGIAAKYRGRLRKEVERCYGKADDQPGRALARWSDPVATQSQRALAARARAPEPPEEPETRAPAIDTSEMEDFRFAGDIYAPESLGGLLGRIARHVLDTALFPVPEFATMAAVVLGATLYGRRWSEPLMGGGLNVYVIATAPSGWGKDHPIQELPRLATKCGVPRLLGPNEFASDAAIEKVLRQSPVRSCFMDEIGIVLQANASRQAGPWEKRIRKAVLSLYSASKGVWSGRQAAGDEKDKGAHPVHRPTLSFYGASTPEELYKGLTEDNVKDGLFGRLIFAAPDGRPERANPGKSDLAAIRADVKAVMAYAPPHVEERQRALWRSNSFNAEIEPDVIRVPASADAVSAIETVLDWQRAIMEREDGLSKIANRAGENVGKLATLRALSRDHTQPLVELDDVQWGWSIVERSLAIITRDMERHMVGSEFEALVKTIVRHLEEAGKGGMKFAELRRRRGVSKAHQRDVMAALRLLQDAGEADIERPTANSRGFRVRST